MNNAEKNEIQSTSVTTRKHLYDFYVAYNQWLKNGAPETEGNYLSGILDYVAMLIVISNPSEHTAKMQQNNCAQILSRTDWMNYCLSMRTARTTRKSAGLKGVT